MRLAALLLIAAASILIAADDAAPKPAKPPVNTVCPVEGAKVDPAIAPIAGKTKEGKTVMIGACGERCAEAIREKPETYADDAVANRRHADK